MIDEKKIFDKFFRGQTFEYGGYKYRFDDIQKIEKNQNLFKICWLPDFYPHSYFVEKLSADCVNIIQERLRYLSLMADGNDSMDIYTPVSDLKKTLFIRKSLLKEIDNEVSKFKTLRLEVRKHRKTYLLGINLYLSKTPYRQNDGSEYITLNFDLDIIYLEDVDKEPGNRLRLNPNIREKELWDFISDSLYDQDTASTIDEIIIPILEPELKIGDYDIYYNSSFKISSIMGRKFEDLKGGSASINDYNPIFV